MKVGTLMLTMVLACAPFAKGQCGHTRETQCLRNLARAFPPLQELEKLFDANFNVMVSLRPEMRSRAKPDDPDVGWGAAIKSTILDNLTLHADGKYTETLAGTAQNGVVVTPLQFQLTTAQLIPTVSLTYEVKLGQIRSGWRQWKAGGNLSRGRDLYYNSERMKLRVAYADFEKLRATFLEKLDANKTDGDGAPAAFQQMKSKAIEVLSMVDFDQAAMRYWLEAVYDIQ